MFFALILALIGGAASSGAQAWQADSTTAMSITGDVRFTPSRITFANGQSLTIRYASTQDFKIQPSLPNGNAKHFHLYLVTGKDDPVLLHGNKLCDRAPTFLAIAFAPPDAPPKGSVYVNFYASPDAPKTWDSPAVCASFTYSVKP